MHFLKIFKLILRKIYDKPIHTTPQYIGIDFSRN